MVRPLGPSFRQNTTWDLGAPSTDNNFVVCCLYSYTKLRQTFVDNLVIMDVFLVGHSSSAVHTCAPPSQAGPARCQAVPKPPRRRPVSEHQLRCEFQCRIHCGRWHCVRLWLAQITWGRQVCQTCRGRGWHRIERHSSFDSCRPRRYVVIGNGCA